MIIINFSHFLTEEQVDQIKDLTKRRIERLIEIPCQMDVDQDFGPQIAKLADHIDLTPAEWRRKYVVINYPALAPAAVTMAADAATAARRFRMNFLIR